MEGLEAMDKECSALGGLFQQVVNDMKNGVPHYDDFVNKAAKLHSQLKSTILSLGSFLDAFQKIADAATNTRGATREIGACLTRIVIRHKAMESRLKTLCSALLDCMILPLQDKLEDWRKTVSNMDKEHAKDYKKLRSEFKKKTENLARLQKKNKKNKPNPEHQKAVDNSLTEVTQHIKHLEDTEKNAVRRALIEERSRYCTFVSCLKPLMDEEIFMVSEFQQLEEITKKLGNHTEDPFKLPPASEQVIYDIIKKGESTFKFQTPPSSPSSLGSRKSSMCSISSAGSSTGSPSHQSGNNNVRLRSLSQQHNPASALGPMRLSSISSQDSGFTSQDTLFLRPHSPSRSKNQVNPSDVGSGGGIGGGGGGIGPQVHWAPPPPSDRPHTISSAYEKGHMRAQLQPYTFSPPQQISEEKSEHQEEEEEQEEQASGRNSGGGGGTLLRRIQSQQGSTAEKPPVPQRCVSLERPNLPPNKPVVPQFHANKHDMVIPQPVYMNMNDLANMAAARAKQQQQPQNEEEEDSSDLKTPTAEELSVPEQKTGDGGSSTSESSLGSSSGYGSQSTMRLDEQQQQQQQQLQQQQQQQQQQQKHQNMHEGFDMPLPAPLLDDSRYRSLARQEQESREMSPPLPPPPPEIMMVANSNRMLMRPFSFTPGIGIPEIPEENTGGTSMVNGAPGVATLRRSSSQCNKPPPPMRRTPSISSPPPPAPPLPVASSSNEEPGSNSTTPRGSMENLPPPPPHLLHSDNDEDSMILTQRSLSVAESVRALQNLNHRPASPKTLRRAHSLASGDCGARSSIVQALNSQLRGPSPQRYQPRPPEPHQEQIYAPVAHLQQKIQKQLQPPLQQQMMQRQQQQQQPGVGVQRSPEGEQYGFGIQFYQHQSQFYHEMQEAGIPMNTAGGSLQYGSANHDQIMRDIDEKMRQRPLPPPIPPQMRQGGSNGGGGGILFNNRPASSSSSSFSSNYDQQTANRVRRWIESKSVGDVQLCRPYLNAEIKQGFALRKTSNTNDRSAPRFH